MWIEVREGDKKCMINSFMVQKVSVDGAAVVATLNDGKNATLGVYSNTENANKAYERLQREFAFRHRIQMYDETKPDTIVSYDNGLNETAESDDDSFEVPDGSVLPENDYPDPIQFPNKEVTDISDEDLPYEDSFESIDSFPDYNGED